MPHDRHFTLYLFRVPELEGTFFEATEILVLRAGLQNDTRRDGTNLFFLDFMIFPCLPTTYGPESYSSGVGGAGMISFSPWFPHLRLHLQRALVMGR